MLNVRKIGKDFPIDSGIIYLDNASSSLIPEPVINKMLGPAGIKVLCLKGELLDALESLCIGRENDRRSNTERL